MMRQQPTDRRRDHEKRRAYAQKAELEAEVEALIRVRRKRERLADTHDSD